MERILIAEDDKILAKYYSKLLSQKGFTISLAVDGEEALRKSLEEHPDLILLDISMPKIDGLTVMSRLRNDSWGKNAKIIILTNLDATDEKLQAVVRDQPGYYLLKVDISNDELLEKIQDLLQN